MLANGGWRDSAPAGRGLVCNRHARMLAIRRVNRNQEGMDDHAEARRHPGDRPLYRRHGARRAFYEGVLELQPIFSDSRLCAYGVAGTTCC